MKPVTFAHITYQTGHSQVYRGFSPIRAAREVLSIYQGPGYYNLMGVAVAASKRADGSWIFDISVDGDFLVRVYACYDSSKVQECWESVMDECQLGQSLPGAVEPWVSPSALSAVRPTGPFMLVEIKDALGGRLGAIKELGEFERGLYWRFAQL